MTDRVFATAGKWALGADEVQWILYRQQKGDSPWRSISFVHSTRDVLARCMQEKDIEPDTADLLLSGLPDTFAQWKALQSSPQGPEQP
jgi:hypothetical protein